MGLRFLVAFLFISTWCNAQHAISGKVTGSDGEALIGAVVQVDDENIQPVLSSVTGSFEIFNVPKGEYTLTVNYIGYSATRSVITVENDLYINLALEFENTIEDVVVSVRGRYGGAINGDVFDENFERVPKASIRALPTDRGVLSSMSGEFKMGNLEDGEYTIEASHPVFGEQTQTVNIVEGMPVRLQFHLVTALGINGDGIDAADRIPTSINGLDQDIARVPLALTSNERRQLQNLRIDDFYSLSQLNSGTNNSNSWTNFPTHTVRGITSYSNGFYDEPRIAILTDGMPLGKMPALRPHDVERIEVLRGPQSVLLGPQAMAGAYNVVQAKAKDEESAAAGISLGNHLDLIAQGHVNKVLEEDVLFGRVSAFYNRRDGYIENIAGSNLNGEDTKAIRASAHYIPAENITLDGALNFQKDVFSGLAHRSIGFPSIGTTANPFGNVNLDRADQLGQNRNSWNLNLNGTMDLENGMQVKANGGYNRYASQEKNDADGTIAQGLAIDEDLKSSLFYLTGSLHFGSADKKTESFVGLSIQKENASREFKAGTDEQSYFTASVPYILELLNASPDYTDAEKAMFTSQWFSETDILDSQGQPNQFYTSVPGTTSFYNTIFNTSGPLDNLAGYQFQGLREEQSIHDKTSSAVDFFGNLTYHVSEKFDINGGLRFSAKNRTQSLEVLDSNPTELFYWSASMSAAVIPVTNGDYTFKKDNSSIDARLILDYKASNLSKFYTSISTGSKPHVIIEEPTVENDHQFNREYTSADLGKEAITNVEVGYSGLSKSLKNRLKVNGYAYNYKNYVARTYTQLTPHSAVGDVKAYGGDVSWSGLFGKTFEAYASYSYNHARFTGSGALGKFDNPAFLADQPLLFSPDHSTALSLAKNITIGKYQLTLAPSVKYRSKMLVGYSQNQYSTQEGYTTANINIMASDPEKQLSFSLFAENIAGQDFLINSDYYGAAFNMPTTLAGTPRFFGGGLKWEMPDGKKPQFKDKLPSVPGIPRE